MYLFWQMIVDGGVV
uniref:Uncharacterized protein n=1 Tax=Anguilla anguilla TaxID=7936 RepID=A0A0E9QTQ3_ANGAN